MFHSVRSRIIATFLVVLVAVVVASSIVGFFYSRWHVERETDELGRTAATACAVLFEGIAEDDERLDPNSQDYWSYRELLRGFCIDSGMDYLSIFECDLENGTITYLISVAADDSNDAMAREKRGYGSVVDCQARGIDLRALWNEGPYAVLENDNEFGHTFSYFMHIEGWDKPALASAEYSVDELWYHVIAAVTATTIILVIALIVLLLVELRVLHVRVFKPIQLIAGRMRGFSAEHAEAFEPLDVGSDDEIGALAGAFGGMANDIKTYLGDIERMTEERVHDSVELDVARRIQIGMVPPTTSISGEGFEICAFAQPARRVGGDFYDIVRHDDGSVAVVIGDVSGKGVAAALFMSMAKAMIAGGLAAGDPPATVLNHVNDEICKSNPEDMFATVFAALLDPGTGKVRYANAGHLPPLVVGGDARTVPVDPGTLIGLFDGIDLQEGELVLAEGEALLLVTDGVTEALNEDRAFFGDERLPHELSGHAPYAGARALVDAVLESVHGFTGDLEQSDDLTVVALARTAGPAGDTAAAAAGAGPDGMHGLDVDIAAFAAVREAVLSTGLDERRRREACLACEEAFVNIVSHSRAEHAWYALSEDDAVVEATLADDGVPFDPLSAEPVDRQFEDLDAGGMGIGLYRSLATDVRYRREGGRNILTLCFGKDRRQT